MSSIRVVIRSLRLLSRRDRRVLALAVLAQAVVALLDLVGVLLLGGVAAIMTASLTEGGGSTVPLMDRLGLGEISTEAALTIAAIAGALLIIKSLASWFLTRRIFMFLANRQAMLAGATAERLLTRPLSEVRGVSSQQTAVALTVGIDAITQNIIAQAMVITAELTLIAVLAAGLFIIDPVVTLLTVAYFSALAIIMQRFLGVRARRLGTERHVADVESVVVVQNALRTYRETTVLGRRSFFIRSFQTLRWQVARYMADMYLTNQIGKYVFEIGLVLGAGSLAIFLLSTKDLPTAVGVLAVTLIAASRLFPSLLRTQSALLSVRNAEGFAEPSFQLIDRLGTALVSGQSRTRGDHEQPRSSASDYSGFDSEVVVNRVSLKYPDRDSWALLDISLTCPSGSMTAIVGPSGSGKTSLVDVMLGVQSPTQGQVSLSRTSIPEAIERWPGAVAYVPQDVYVVDGDVRANVALGINHDAVDDALVWEALARAHMDQFVSEDPRGIHASVGEGGIRLSGGQRQRLGIARALYSRPKLLFLDEATSALDAETERNITETLETLGGEVTIVVVAHRLATVLNADQVVYLDGGRLCASGSFDAVRAAVKDFDRQASILGL